MNQQLATTTAYSPIALPTDAMQAMQLAEKLAGSRLIPPHFQKSPADVFMAMSFCRHYGLEFFMAIQRMSVIRNKLFIESQLINAMVWASGALAERLNYEYSGDGDDRTITVRGRLVNEAEYRTVTVRLGDVKTQNENWEKNPDQQLSYAGVRIWARRHTPDLILGVIFEGETIDVTPTSVIEHKPAISPSLSQDERSKAAEIAALTETKPEIATPAEPEKAKPYALPACHDDEWRAWAAQLIGHIRAETDENTIETWLKDNYDQLQNMREIEPKMYRAFENAVELHKHALNDPAEEVVP